MKLVKALVGTAVAAAGLALVGAGATAIARAVLAEPEIVQPVAFPHRAHVEKAKLECAFCHRYVRETEFATLPSVKVCAECHNKDDEPEEALPKDPAGRAEVLKVQGYVSTSEPIPWQRLYRVPGHVFFSHRRHVGLGGIDCAECHGPMAEQTRPPAHALRALRMDDCIACHQRQGASVDCIACHR